MNKENVLELTKYIFIDSKPQKADLAIVFGTRYMEPANKVYELYKNKHISKILLTGGVNKFTKVNEAIKIEKHLLDLGVNPEDLIIEPNASNSLENVLFAKKLIDQKFNINKITKIIAIVKNFHSRRVLMTLKKHFPSPIKFIPITYEIESISKNNWHKSELGKKLVLSEYTKIKKYLKKGDIEEL